MTKRMQLRRSGRVGTQFPLGHDSSRQRQTWVKPEAVITVKMLQMMSDSIARNIWSSQGTME